MALVALWKICSWRGREKIPPQDTERRLEMRASLCQEDDRSQREIIHVRDLNKVFFFFYDAENKIRNKNHQMTQYILWRSWSAWFYNFTNPRHSCNASLLTGKKTTTQDWVFTLTLHTVFGSGEIIVTSVPLTAHIFVRNDF